MTAEYAATPSGLQTARNFWARRLRAQGRPHSKNCNFEYAFWFPGNGGIFE
jgi:hypothetical protein